MKKITITVNDKKNSLLTQLRGEGHILAACCGGRGTCGKCRVRFLYGAPEANDEEKGLLSPEALKDGWRLACQTYVKGIFELEIEDCPEDDIAAADSFQGGEGVNIIEIEGQRTCVLAVDLGTTTIAASLIDITHQDTLRTLTSINHQRAFGADVLSRIDAANRGEGPKLQEIVLKDISALCGRLGIGDDVEELSIPVFISGNTTMEHLLQGLSCKTLGIFPFTPVDISLHQYKNMTILPGISTYVGADIVSGIVACGIDQKKEISILVDLGTNGEMIIGNKDRILAASTAAGPAFEGGNISCGVAGVPGAIDTVVIEDGKTQITTIGRAAPVGICGTGALETVYELVKEEIVDETGRLDEDYFKEGFPLAPGITFTAKDIRELQLAKSAIRCGIEILLISYGIRYDQVDRLYLAGGFGQKINCEKAVGIGMIPEELKDRITAVGNSSLEGANMLAKDPSLEKRFLRIAGISEEVTLSNHELFNDLYMEHMFF